MKKAQPLVTVLMPVYNGSKYLGEAIESILNQSFTDFEFLIIDDGSTDKSVKIIKSYDDERIRLVKNIKNLGQRASLNMGIELALGKYIARMDQDDVSLSTRLAKEVKVLDASPNCGLISTNCYLIDANGKVSDSSILKKDLTGGQVEWYLLWGNPIVHPTVMFRTKLVQYLKGYPDIFNFHVEDYVLWSRLVQKKSIIILSEPLLLLRKHDLSATEVDSEPHIAEHIQATQEILATRVGYKPLTESISVLMNLSRSDKLSLLNTKEAIKILFNAYKFLARKYQLDKNELSDIEEDFFNRFARLIKLNIPYGIKRVLMVLGYALFLLPTSMLNRWKKETMVKLFLVEKFHYRYS